MGVNRNTMQSELDLLDYDEPILDHPIDDFPEDEQPINLEDLGISIGPNDSGWDLLTYKRDHGILRNPIFYLGVAAAGIGIYEIMRHYL